MSALHVEHIVKTFQKPDKTSFRAVDDVSLSISEGTIHGLLGPNGAGKSTLMRIITGYYFPDSGDVKIGNESVFLHPSLKKKIGYLPEVNPLYEDM